MILFKFNNNQTSINIILFLILLYIIFCINKFDINRERFKLISNNIKKFESEIQIPKDIYICHKELSTINKYSQIWKKINPNYKLKLYDNFLCRKFFEENYSKEYIQIFDYLKDGPIKADFWRICVLNTYGGVYADSDIEPFIPIDDFLESNIDLVICSTYSDYSFNPNFIISYKNNPILQDCINWYLKKYNNKDKYDYWGWSIVTAFNNTLKLNNYDKKSGIYIDQKYKKNVQILQQVENNFTDDYVTYKGVKLFNDRNKNYDSENHVFKDM